MKRAALSALLVVLTAGAANAQAQQKSSAMRMSTDGLAFPYNIAKGYIMKTAEQLSQDKYAYQPTKEVRTAAQLLGHIADSQHMFCSAIEGKKMAEDAGGSEKLTDKAALINALKASFAHCDAVLAKLDDNALMNSASIFGQTLSVAGVWEWNTAHLFEHYGNLVTYMRLNGMVPPSSQQ